MIKDIYTTNKKQSTTFNAFGVYDLNSGSIEVTASYVNNITAGSEAPNYCGTNKGDLYGADETERATSTAYKTVYPSNRNSYKVLDFAGDAIYETSDGSGGIYSAWTSNGSSCDKTYMPYWRCPVFSRPGVFGWYAGSNIVGGGNGSWTYEYSSSVVRLVLAIR